MPLSNDNGVTLHEVKQQICSRPEIFCVWLSTDQLLPIVVEAVETVISMNRMTYKSRY